MQLKRGVTYTMHREAPTIISVTARAVQAGVTVTVALPVTQGELDAALASDDVAADIQLGGGWG